MSFFGVVVEVVVVLLKYRLRRSLLWNLSICSCIKFFRDSLEILGTGRNLTPKPRTIFSSGDKMKFDLLCISMLVMFLNLFMNCCCELVEV